MKTLAVGETSQTQKNTHSSMSVVKHAQLHSDLLQALKGEYIVELGVSNNCGINLCVCSTPLREHGW